MARQIFNVGDKVMVYSSGGRERYHRRTRESWVEATVIVANVDKTGSEWRRKWVARPGGTYVGVWIKWRGSGEGVRIEYVHNSRRMVLNLEDYERDIAAPQRTKVACDQLLEARRANLADKGADILVYRLMHATREVQREIVIANVDRTKLIEAAQKAGAAPD